jgi:hypothetical protein
MHSRIDIRGTLAYMLTAENLNCPFAQVARAIENWNSYERWKTHPIRVYTDYHGIGVTPGRPGHAGKLKQDSKAEDGRLSKRQAIALFTSVYFLVAIAQFQ